MKKRVLSIVLSVLMLVSVCSVMAVPASAAAIGFSVNPAVLIGGGDEYNIVWENNNISVGYVTYKYQGKTYTVYDEENGVVRSDDKMHTVRVPRAHLDAAGSYTVNASTVTGRTGYDIKLGDTTSVSRSFKGLPTGDKITLGFLSDTHLLYNNETKYSKMINAVKTAVTTYLGNPDLVVLNGDITNNMEKEEEFYGLFDIFAAAGLDGTRPVLYTMGNHEKRGAYSIKLEKYLTYDTGEFYTQFDIGAASIIITDIGEDKADDNIEYGGLIDMDHYFDEQYAYLFNSDGYTEDATYKFSIGHSPSYIDRYIYADYVDLLYNMGTDVHICGHNHALRYDPTTKKVNFPVFSDGGHDNNEAVRTTLLTLENGNYSFKGFDASGNVLIEQTVEGQLNGSSKAEASKAPAVTEPETNTETETVTETDDTAVVVPTRAGVSTAAIKGANDSTAMTTKPVVFDAGEYYCIVWQTTAGVPCGGYVDIAGQSKVWMDSHGGKLRQETTHSVRIPKEMLSGKTYTVKSRVCTNYNAYGYYNTNNMTTYGPYATGTAIKFSALPGDKSTKYTVLAVANKTGGKEDAQKLTAQYKSTPNLLVMLGGMTSAINTEADFGKYILEYANEVTGGQYPVLFLRGEGEASGEFAANLARHIRTFTTQRISNRLYSSFVLGGNYSIIGLDTAATKPDSDANYKGFAQFDKYRQEQVEWLGSLPKAFAGKYNLLFANASNLADCCGYNFTENFKDLSVHLVVSAGSGDAAFVNGKSSYSQATVGSSNGLVITCQNDEIKVESIAATKTELGVIKTADVTYEAGVTTPEIEEPSTPSTPDNPSTPSEEDPEDEGKNEDPKEDDEKEDPEGEGEEDPEEDDEKEDPEDDGKQSSSGQYVPSSGNGIDGSLYLETVPDGWYEDYLDFDIEIESDGKVTITGDVAEGTFIYVVARVAGANDTLFDDSTKEDRASSWAEKVGIVSSYVGGEDTISKTTAAAIVQSLFEIL